MPTMSKREQLRQKNPALVKRESSPTIIDDVISINSSNEDPSKEKKEEILSNRTEGSTSKDTNVKQDTVVESKPADFEQVALNDSIPAQNPGIIRIDPPKKKQTKCVRKCFLITPEMDDKLKKMAQNYDTSENEIINQILSQVL